MSFSPGLRRNDLTNVIAYNLIEKLAMDQLGLQRITVYDIIAWQRIERTDVHDSNETRKPFREISSIDGKPYA